jgi:hypothetical protein
MYQSIFTLHYISGHYSWFVVYYSHAFYEYLLNDMTG